MSEQIKSNSFDIDFKKYRETLKQEVSQFACYIGVLKRIDERKSDRLKEINLAPAFFNVVINSLHSSIVIWAHKLLDETGQFGFFNFLMLIEYNRKHMSIDSLRKRRDYKDNHWMLERDDITLNVINIHRKRIKALNALNSLKLRRDKYDAHFDKGYIFEPSKLETEAKLEWKDLYSAIDLMWEIINHYSAAFDGNTYMGAPININDVDTILDRLYRLRQQQNSA